MIKKNSDGHWARERGVGVRPGIVLLRILELGLSGGTFFAASLNITKCKHMIFYLDRKDSGL